MKEREKEREKERAPAESELSTRAEYDWCYSISYLGFHSIGCFCASNSHNKMPVLALRSACVLLGYLLGACVLHLPFSNSNFRSIRRLLFRSFVSHLLLFLNNLSEQVRVYEPSDSRNNRYYVVIV